LRIEAYLVTDVRKDSPARLVYGLCRRLTPDLSDWSAVKQLSPTDSH